MSGMWHKYSRRQQVAGLLMLGVLMGISACSNKGKVSPTWLGSTASPLNPTHIRLTPSETSDTLRSLIGHENEHPCDKTYRSTKLRALDIFDQTTTLLETQKKQIERKLGANEKVIPFMDGVLLDIPAKPHEDWKRSEGKYRSWSEIQKLIDIIARSSEPLELSREKKFLYALLMGMGISEYRRLEKKTLYLFDLNPSTELDTFYQVLGIATGKPLKTEQELQAWMASKSVFKPTENNPKLRKKQLNTLKQIYGPEKSNGVFFNGNTFTIHLNFEKPVSDNDRQLLKEVIEKKWSGHGFKSKLNISDAKSSGVFQLFFSLLPGRSYVVQSENKIQLHSYDDLHTIKHEFGHVLGLPDRYFETFNEEICGYQSYSRTNDLMSNHLGDADPTPQDFLMLKQLYSSPEPPLFPGES